jgi:hypothetical protein
VDYRIFRETIIARAEEYASYLEKLLRFKQEQTPLEIHTENESTIIEDSTLKILCQIRMPPYMQVLHIEESRLCKYGDHIAEVMGVETLDYSELRVQLEAVRAHIQAWVDEEMEKRPDITQRPNAKDLVPFAGANWHMLIVVEKTKQKPPKRERLGLKKKKEK